MTFFFFNDTATTEIYTLSLHDALPISGRGRQELRDADGGGVRTVHGSERVAHEVVGKRGEVARELRVVLRLPRLPRSEEHTSELQSRQYLVCRLLLEKKKILLLIYLSI